MQKQAAGGKSARGHDKDTTQKNLLDNPTHKTKRKQQRATRRAANNLPETMLTNAEMSSVGHVTHRSYTSAHDAFVAWARTHQLQLDGDHTTLDRVLARCLDVELFAKGRNVIVTWLALFGTICCRGIPPHPHLRAPSGFVRDEHLGERRSEAAPLVGQTCRPCVCHVVRPLHEAIRNIENLEPRRHCLPSAGLPLSARHHCTERGCKRRDNSAVCKKQRIRRHSHGRLAALAARIRAGAPAPSASLPDRCARHVGASTAAIKMLLDLPGIQKKRAVAGYKLRALL